MKNIKEKKAAGEKSKNANNLDIPCPTSVLLVCVLNKRGTVLTHDIFYREFSKFGEVIKILIFEQNKTWKLFIEMDSRQSAERAKQALHQKYLMQNEENKMNIFNSQLPQVNFQANNTGGIDYREISSRLHNINYLLQEKDTILKDSSQKDSENQTPEEQNILQSQDMHKFDIVDDANGPSQQVLAQSLMNLDQILQQFELQHQIEPKTYTEKCQTTQMTKSVEFGQLQSVKGDHRPNHFYINEGENPAALMINSLHNFGDQSYKMQKINIKAEAYIEDTVQNKNSFFQKNSDVSKQTPQQYLKRENFSSMTFTEANNTMDGSNEFYPKRGSKEFMQSSSDKSQSHNRNSIYFDELAFIPEANQKNNDENDIFPGYINHNNLGGSANEEKQENKRSLNKMISSTQSNGYNSAKPLINPTIEEESNEGHSTSIKMSSTLKPLPGLGIQLMRWDDDFPIEQVQVSQNLSQMPVGSEQKIDDLFQLNDEISSSKDSQTHCTNPFELGSDFNFQPPPMLFSTNNQNQQKRKTPPPGMGLDDLLSNWEPKSTQKANGLFGERDLDENHQQHIFGVDDDQDEQDLQNSTGLTKVDVDKLFNNNDLMLGSIGNNNNTNNNSFNNNNKQYIALPTTFETPFSEPMVKSDSQRFSLFSPIKQTFERISENKNRTPSPPNILQSDNRIRSSGQSLLLRQSIDASLMDRFNKQDEQKNQQVNDNEREIFDFQMADSTKSNKIQNMPMNTSNSNINNNNINQMEYSNSKMKDSYSLKQNNELHQKLLKNENSHKNLDTLTSLKQYDDVMTQSDTVYKREEKQSNIVEISKKLQNFKDENCLILLQNNQIEILDLNSDAKISENYTDIDQIQTTQASKPDEWKKDTSPYQQSVDDNLKEIDELLGFPMMNNNCAGNLQDNTQPLFSNFERKNSNYSNKNVVNHAQGAQIKEINQPYQKQQKQIHQSCFTYMEQAREQTQKDDEFQDFNLDIIDCMTQSIQVSSFQPKQNHHSQQRIQEKIHIEEKKPDFYDITQKDHEETKEIQTNSGSFQEAQIFGRNKIDPSTYVNPMFVISNKQSKVIYVRNLDTQGIRCINLYNYFSNFGNIVKIVYLEEKNAALIEFTSEYFSTEAKNLSNNTRFMGNTIQIFFSNHNNINLKKVTNTTDELMLFNESQFRYKEETPLINPPSQVIHISNLKKQASNFDVMIDLFTIYGKIEGIKFLVKDRYKYMCLIKFSNLEESIDATIHMHNQEVFGRKMIISFTRSDI